MEETVKQIYETMKRGENRPTQDDIQKWLLQGKENGASRVLIRHYSWNSTISVVCVAPSEDIHEKMKQCHQQGGYEVMEVYHLALPFEKQLAEKKAWHIF